MPTVSVIMSVIITTKNDPDDWISLSAEPILARTPPYLLVEIIVDGLPENIRMNVDEYEWDYIKSLSSKS